MVGSLKDAALRAIFEYYQKEAPLYHEAYDPYWVENDVSHIDHYTEMERLLSEPQIYIPLDQDPNELSIVFECTWEMEHGVGVCFRDGIIDEVGGADIAF